MRLALAFLILSFAAPSAFAQDDPAQQAMQQMQQSMQQSMDQSLAENQRVQQQMSQDMEEAQEHAAAAQQGPYYTVKPKISLKPGKYGVPQTVKITDASRGATIYYTTDGWTPTRASARYQGPVSINKSVTLQAIAIAPYERRSLVASAAYSIGAPAADAPPSVPPSAVLSDSNVALSLPPGTPVPLVFVSDVNSKSASVGDPIQLALADDLLFGNVVVATKGSAATGVVTAVDKTAMFGFPGVLKFKVQSLNANGKVIDLTGWAKREGEAKTVGAAVAIPVAGPLASLRHGKDAEIAPGTPFIAHVAAPSAPLPKT
jgi:hypothetical protein